jgi:hypothetical protein
MGAAEHWFSGDRQASRAELADQAAALGVSLDLHEPEPTHYEVWPEHEHAVMTFLRCGRQWRAGAGGGVFGLDYNVVLSVMALYDVPDRAAVLEDVQVIEDRAAELINDKARQEAQKR